MSKIKSRTSSQNSINSSRDSPKTISIAVAGDGGVGTTTFIKTYLNNKFIPDTRMTRYVQFFSQDYNDHHKIKYIDLAGQEYWRDIQGDLIKKIDGIILGFDLTRFMTFMNIKKWVKFFRNRDSNIPMTLVAMKSDLVNDINVDDDTISEFTEEYKFIDVIKVSNKTGKNVELAFKKLIRHIIKLKFSEDIMLVNQNKIELKNLSRKVIENELINKNSDKELKKFNNKLNSLYDEQNDQKIEIDLLFSEIEIMKDNRNQLWSEFKTMKDNRKGKNKNAKVKTKDIVKAIGKERSISYAKLRRDLVNREKDISNLEKKLRRFDKNGTINLIWDNKLISEIIFEIDNDLRNEIINLSKNGYLTTIIVSEKCGISLSKAEFYLEHLTKIKTLNAKTNETNREGIKFYFPQA